MKRSRHLWPPRPESGRSRLKDATREAARVVEGAMLRESFTRLNGHQGMIAADLGISTRAVSYKLVDHGLRDPGPMPDLEPVE